MKKIVLSLAVAGLVLAGCSKRVEPTPTPSNSSPSVSVSEGSTPTPEDSTEPTTETPNPPTDEPTTQTPTSTAPTTDPAMPPATAFAQRWGVKYPSVPEYAILKAANKTCSAIADGGDSWQSAPKVISLIEDAVDTAGISKSDALEFAQDADQNYCASIANPT